MSLDDQRLMGGIVLFMLGISIVVAIMANSCAGPSIVSAQMAPPEGLTRLERRLALRIAQVAFNEAADSGPDLEIIAQIVLSHTSPHGPHLDASERLSWLRSHSPCVSGVLTQDQAYERPGNCHWTRNLSPSGRRPRGFHDCHEGEESPGHTEGHPCDGQWSRVRDRWFEVLGSSVEYVSGARTADLCEETPQSWDGKRFGREQLERRGWRVLECSESALNYAVVRQ